MLLLDMDEGGRSLPSCSAGFSVGACEGVPAPVLLAWTLPREEKEFVVCKVMRNLRGGPSW